MESDKPIGVFDSGVGGLSVLRALRAELPKEQFVYFSDAGHAPYGERGDSFVAQRSMTIARQLLDEHRIKALVVACNTATAAAVHLLRQSHPEVPIVGVEPALKPAAALTRTRRVAVFATRGTLESAKFRTLHDSLKQHAEFVLQPCDGLAAAIENGDEDEVASLCERYVRAVGEFGARDGCVDALVLGCTHYPFAIRHLQPLVGDGVHLVETGQPVARHTRRVLEERQLLQATEGRVQFKTTGCEKALAAAAERLLAA